MTKTDTNLPQYFQVKMGKTEYEIETESLVSTLCHQFLTTNREAYNPSHYDILFNTTKQEIEDYLNHLYENHDNFIDLFGNWSEDFNNFQNEKNKIYCRDLVIDFSDGSKWNFRLLDILSYKYGDQEFGFDIDHDDPVLTSDEKLIEWVSELNWNDISHLAEEIKRPQPELDYSIEWKTASKEVKNWEKTINILDLFEITAEDDDDEDDD